MIHSQRLAAPRLSDVLVETQQVVYHQPGQKIIFWRFFAVMFLLLTLVFAWPQKAAFEQSISPDNILNLLNQDREKTGVKPLEMNSRLNRAAYAKAEHMLRNSYFAHTSPQGVEPWDFIKQQNFQYAFAGENLAMNYTSTYELENDFLQSSSHRENLLSPLYSEIGIAVVEGNFEGQQVILTVQLFASPANSLVGVAN